MSQTDSRTNVNDFLGELDGGVFKEKIALSLSEVAEGVISTGKKGKVTITFDLAQISDDSQQVTVEHKLQYMIPRKKGKSSEEETTKTPMYVGRRGKMTLWPQEQVEMKLEEKDEPEGDNITKLHS